MESLDLKPARSVRRFLRETTDKFLGRSPTPVTSQQPSPAPSIQSISPHPELSNQSSLTHHYRSDNKIQASTPTEATTSISAVDVSTSWPIGPPTIVDPPAIVELFMAAETPSGNEIRTNSPSPLVSGPASPASQQPTPGVWRGLGTALRVLRDTTQLFPVQSAEALNEHREYDELASELAAVTEILTHRLGPSTHARMSGSISKIVRDIEGQSRLIESKRGRGIGSRLREAGANIDELVNCCRRVESLFRQLQTDISLSTWNIVNDHMTHTRLTALGPVKLAHHDSSLSTEVSRRTCTEGTRVAILAGLGDWSCDPGAADIYWMNGMAGTGKTTIACTFSESLEERGQLGASFFCTRTVPECRDINRIIPTIAYQLAQYSIPYQSALCEVLSQDPNIGSKKVMKQFERLLKAPLLKVKDAIPNDLVVTIDALDECDDMVGVELLLSAMLKSAADLPLKFFVTSRPEPEIYNRMLARGQGYRTVMHLHEVERSLVRADIELYLEAELLDYVSPTSTQIQELARRSGTLFIYAATLVRYIRSRKAQADPQERLQDVLLVTSEANQQYVAIDALYAAVLRTALDEEELKSQEVENVRRVLQTVICVQEPVSIEVLAALTGINDERRTAAALQPLRAVLHFSESTGLVSTLHASFPDFLFDKTRSGPFYCELAAQSQLVTRHCFEVMKTQLRFNICKLESSFIPDREVGDLDQRINRAISPVLSYACRYWGHHLRMSSYVDWLSVLLYEFLANRLLFWMEVLNLKRKVGIGIDMLLKAKQWLSIGDAPGDIAKLAEDARNFVTSFAANPVSRSTPHIYISWLPFCPKSSSVLKEYWKKTKGLMEVTGSSTQKREASALATWEAGSGVRVVAYSPNGDSIVVGCKDGTITIRNACDGEPVAGPFEGHSDAVSSVAYSRDGNYIVSGSHDRTVRTWSAHDGTPVTGPFNGHGDSVLSAVYSPEGTKVVSSSSDSTIRVWNAHNGTHISNLFRGHTDSVLSAVFSPDGTCIATGSYDCTIQIWDAYDGKPVASPFEGHTDTVWSVAYSPDGAHIVSGSLDKTIRLWNAYNGKPIPGMFEGHTDSVLSVAYSPDGTRVVSGSSDKTVRVWNAHDGTPAAGVFEGHTDTVWSVAYSPDGTIIVSGSYDNTIRVWNAHNGMHVTGPFEGHADTVWSVAYSPNGTHIASGSYDDVIRVWDAHDGTPVGPSFKGHTDSVLSAAYSPDGTRIVSGSSDCTIRVWSAEDGTLVAGPFEGHSDSVLSVAYSPDGTRIVSRSSDETIRVWDARDGTPIPSLFKGHNGSILSVSYSPDSTRIVSGSVDKTIRVWDASDGTPTAGPFEGHTDSVWSVAYSPDGTRIVSGSSDCTIRVWNAEDGTHLGDPFRGHTSWVLLVAYSPDGTRIVSGSNDKTIRVWNAHDGTPIAGIFEGHDDAVLSVAYSPDGTRIVSGSSDNTIRAWDVRDGMQLSVLSALNVAPKPDSTISNDGWITYENTKLLLWVPSELRFARMTPTLRCVLAIVDQAGSLGVDYGNMLFGPQWDQCYVLE